MHLDDFVLVYKVFSLTSSPVIIGGDEWVMVHPERVSAHERVNVCMLPSHPEMPAEDLVRGPVAFLKGIPDEPATLRSPSPDETAQLAGSTVCDPDGGCTVWIDPFPYHMRDVGASLRRIREAMLMEERKAEVVAEGKRIRRERKELLAYESYLERKRKKYEENQLNLTTLRI